VATRPAAVGLTSLDQVADELSFSKFFTAPAPPLSVFDCDKTFLLAWPRECIVTRAAKAAIKANREKKRAQISSGMMFCSLPTELRRGLAVFKVTSSVFGSSTSLKTWSRDRRIRVCFSAESLFVYF
jgi:hypothetical protein